MARPEKWTPARIRSLRKRCAETQAALAGRVGVSWRTVQDWEQGRRSPGELSSARLDEAEKVAR